MNDRRQPNSHHPRANGQNGRIPGASSTAGTLGANHSSQALRTPVSSVAGSARGSQASSPDSWSRYEATPSQVQRERDYSPSHSSRSSHASTIRPSDSHSRASTQSIGSHMRHASVRNTVYQSQSSVRTPSRVSSSRSMQGPSGGSARSNSTVRQHGGQPEQRSISPGGSIPTTRYINRSDGGVEAQTQTVRSPGHTDTTLETIEGDETYVHESHNSTPGGHAAGGRASSSPTASRAQRSAESSMFGGGFLGAMAGLADEIQRSVRGLPERRLSSSRSLVNVSQAAAASASGSRGSRSSSVNQVLVIRPSIDQDMDHIRVGQSSRASASGRDASVDGRDGAVAQNSRRGGRRGFIIMSAWSE